MPIYEFYCPDCHTVFAFFSARIDTASRPDCPRCRRPALGRRPSTFVARGAAAGSEEALDRLEEAGLEGALDELAGELAGLDEERAEDPRTVARLLRRLGAASGLEPGARLEELIGRLEAGEDLESLEGELDDAFGEEEGAEELFRMRRALARRRRPRVDDTLYFL